MAESGKDVCRLGEALEARVAEVLDLTVARAGDLYTDAALQDSAVRISRISTTALARWMAGEDPAVARQASTETWVFYGELAARRTASLNHVITHCLCWRDAVASVLRQSAVQLGVSPEALSQSQHMLQVGLEVGFVQIAKAFDSERERTDGELAFMTSHDVLTGLPNRTSVLRRTEQMLVRARRHRTPVAALVIGLDDFKRVNETLSRGAGDELLRSVAERLDGAVRDSDALGRLGGDEFVVIADEFSPDDRPELIAERLRAVFEKPFTLAGEDQAQLVLTASIGIATAPRSSAEELLRDADIAMHQAKWDGKDRSVAFAPGMQDAVRRRMELEMDLRDALSNDEFFLQYQPILKLCDMSPTGVEALVRWRHPTRGLVQPDDFVPLLEATGLIDELGSWIMQTACRQCARWREAGHPVTIAVNVSGRQLDCDKFVGEVRRALTKSALDASALTLEITETTVMRSVEDAALRLLAIRELGVRIAIDDFGTGYSSMAHLQRLPVDALKIDRSFIARLTRSSEGRALVHTLVQLGKALSIDVVAEGIEQPEELSILQEEQCDRGQGRFFAPPLDADAAESFLQSWASGAGRASVHAPQHSGRHALTT